jgi:AhpD family alkylhydroperoxidase
MSHAFPAYDETSAPEPARAALLGAKHKFGAIPKPLARYASSPLFLRQALTNLDAFEQTSLAPLEREVLAMTMGRLNGCGFCVATHERLLAAMKASPELVSALTEGRPLDDRRLEALRSFTLALLEQRGGVDEPTLASFLNAGYTHAQALEVVLGVATYTLTTFANRLLESGADPVDA